MTARCNIVYPHAPSTHCVLADDHVGPHVTSSGMAWRDSPDLMDGGVTCAAIEKEAEDEALTLRLVQQQRDQAIARAETAEHYRDTYRQDAIKAEQERDAARGALRARLGVLAEPRPLTADDITDEMVERYLNHRDPDEVRDWRLAGYRDDLVEKARAHLVATLTEPTRPEGAKEIEALLTGNYAEPRYVADFLAERGVRVVGEERS